MKKIILTTEQVDAILKMYNEELLGSQTISVKLNINKQIILRTLRENNVSLGPSGRRNIGGKKVADKKWRDSNKEYVSEKSKKWYSKNKDKWNNYIKEYRKNNVDKIRQIKRDYERNRKARDPLYKLISNFRTAIYQVLKESNVEKNGHYFDILQYSPEELIIHLEKQFKDDMTWDNYGVWHVDHKLPITSFDIQEIGDEEFMKCWCLDNLQPMWGEDNIRKSNKLL
jgi:membrane-associated HD superfamily phosphohydrolase